MSSSSSSSSPIRSWRTAFLTVRDETTLASTPPGPTVIDLLDQLIFSQSDSLIAAAPQLPPHEVMSDFMLLLELARKVSSNSQGIEDTFFIKLSHLIHGISHCSRFQMNSMSWALLLGSSQSIVPFFLNTAKTKSSLIGNPAVIKATRQYLETIRCLFGLYQTAVSLSEHEQLLSVVLQIVDCSQGESIHLSYLTDKYNVSGGVWEVLAVAFSMISEVYSSVGASLAVEIWQSTIEVLRKVMDILASKNFLLENTIIAMFYIELLHCLHLVLREPRGHLADHVAGFVAALKIFFCYGLTNKSLVMKKSKEVSSTSKTPQFEVPKKSRSGPYRPPHLRNKVVPNQHNKDNGPLVSPKHEFTSSDSECSDNDGSMTDNSGYCFAKARLAAITCIQDLCRVDPKLFTSQWTMLLPSSDVLLQRKNETTLMSCLLFDPYVKVRIAAGSTIMSMLDGPASVSLRVAEFRGRSRAGSFTALSSSLGDILMQLHSGTLHLIKHETDTRLLGLSFKILMLLISSTPYSRMSEELLPMVLSSIQSRIDLGFSFQSDPVSLLSTVINCLTLALSVSPCSTSVNDMLMREVSTGSMEGRQRSGVLYTLFRYSEQLSSPSISLEAFQALKAVAHNYPSVISLCWEQISSIVYGALFASSDIPVRSWKGNVEPTVEPMKERLIAAAIKVLDECLRAISGFKGTEDLSNDKFLESPFTSDCVKTKAISSAPSYSLESPISVNGESETFLLASERWSEVTTKHMPIINKHPSAMIRAASVTCFAGMTSSVFLSLTKDKQEFITSSLTDAALNDGVPSVRSAACRAIGVIAFFPQIYHSTDVLEKFIHAVEHNALDSLLSVRITAAWALANICDSLGHCMDAPGTETRKLSQFISLLFDNALRLTRDNDKVKANAVRALGNLSRFIQLAGRPIQHGDLENLVHLKLERDGAKAPKREMLDSFPLGPSGSSNWLDQMVQAFLSCVTTGNVKVQWNVCHALSNLFSNKTLKLQDKDWGSSVFSILLLLLRDSSNFKIRIQAAAALAVPQTLSDYGRSYYDVVKGVEHVVENFKSDQISEPSNFKYWIALEKQLTSTMLHLLGLAASCDHRAIQDLLTKKASFLEVWIKDLCASLGDTTYSHGEAKQLPSVDQKKDVLLETIRSLVRVYENSNQHLIADKFERLANGLR